MKIRITSIPKQYAFGGNIKNFNTHGGYFSNGVIEVNEGKSHEQNPYQGVIMGIDPEGNPNLVEEGEVIWNDYVFSNRLNVPENFRGKYKLKSKEELTYADAAKELQKESEERPNDPISKRGLDASMADLAMSQEQQRQLEQEKETMMNYAALGGLLTQKNKKGRKYKSGGNLFFNGGLPMTVGVGPFMEPVDRGNYEPIKGLTEDEYNLNPTLVSALVPSLNTTMLPELKTSGVNMASLPQFSNNNNSYNNSSYDWETGLRYIPAIGSAIGVFSDLMGWTNNPDYSNADMILNANNLFRDVNFTPKYNYMQYRPVDRMSLVNPIMAASNAVNRAIMNDSAFNRGTALAGLLANNYGKQANIGKAYLDADDIDYGRYKDMLTFNNDVNRWIAEQDMKAQMANQGRAEVQAANTREAAKLRESIDAAASTGRSANLTNLFNSLGDIGWEAFNRNMVNSSNALYGMNRDGSVYYKPALRQYLTPQEWDEAMNKSTAPERKYELLRMAQSRLSGQSPWTKDNKKSCGGYLTIKGGRR